MKVIAYAVNALVMNFAYIKVNLITVKKSAKNYMDMKVLTFVKLKVIYVKRNAFMKKKPEKKMEDVLNIALFLLSMTILQYIFAELVKINIYVQAYAIYTIKVWKILVDNFVINQLNMKVLVNANIHWKNISVIKYAF